jgi:uncharacterized protein YciI
MRWFVLLGYNDPGFDPLDAAVDEALDEAHQSYMDLVADRLLARGPMMTSNHNGHIGSMHIIRARNRDEAQRFAFQEPYYLAGLYERLVVFEFDSWLDKSMWERVGNRDAGKSWLVLWRWDAESLLDCRSQPIVPTCFLCAGWMIKGFEGSRCGALMAFDSSEELLPGTLTSIRAQLPVGVGEPVLIPWRRGGRL